MFFYFLLVCSQTERCVLLCNCVSLFSLQFLFLLAMFRCTAKLVKLLAKGQVAVWKRTTFDRELWHSFSSAECSVFRVGYSGLHRSQSAFNQYSSCLRQNSRFYVMTLSTYAKSKYKIQNAWDRLVNGERVMDAARVAFMVCEVHSVHEQITNSMKQELANLNYPSEEINQLKPSHAQYVFIFVPFSLSIDSVE